MFIPIYMGGGGGGPMGPKEKLAMIAAFGLVISGYVVMFRYMFSPGFQMKVTQEHNNYSADINIRQENYPEIKKVTHKNIDCLYKKGYAISENLDMSSYVVSWQKIAYLETVDRSNKYIPKSIELSKEKLVNDCKECDVYTEIIYKYDNILRNEKQAKKKLYWHKCYEDELK